MPPTSEQLTRKERIVTSLTAGAFAGAIAKTTIAPLDRTKINFQIDPTRKYSFRGAIRFLVKSVRRDGVLSLWRGNSATMARIMPYAAIQYASHEQWKALLNPTHEKHIPPGPRFLAGSLAGMTSSTATYPLDMVRARLAVTGPSRYTGLMHVFRSICKEEGVGKLYRGYLPTVLGQIPYAGCSFFTYETLKKWHAEKFRNQEPHPLQRLCYGAAAGVTGQTTSYPLDIVRRRMQTAGLHGLDDKYRHLVASIVMILKTEGLKGGLFKGLSMNWIKGPIAVGISFMTFDVIQGQLRRLKLYNT